jgi:hypothetical protein
MAQAAPPLAAPLPTDSAHVTSTNIFLACAATWHIWTHACARYAYDDRDRVGAADMRWGTFSTKIPGRVGYQCSNYYLHLKRQGLNRPEHRDTGTRDSLGAASAKEPGPPAAKALSHAQRAARDPGTSLPSALAAPSSVPVPAQASALCAHRTLELSATAATSDAVDGGPSAGDVSMSSSPSAALSPSTRSPPGVRVITSAAAGMAREAGSVHALESGSGVSDVRIGGARVLTGA